MKRILYIIFANPGAYPPLHHSARIFAKHGWKVTVLGVIGDDASSKMHFPEHENIETHLMYLPQPGWRQKIAYVRFVMRAIVMTMQTKPQWIYASDPYSCLPAMLIKLLLRKHTLYHEHDAPGEARTLFDQLTRQFRIICGRISDLCVIPNEARLIRFSKETGRKKELCCVWNCPLKVEVNKKVDAENQPHLEEFIVVYSGSLGFDRLPTSLLPAISHCPFPVRLKIIGYESINTKSFRMDFKNQSLKVARNLRVEDVGCLCRDEMLNEIRGANVGLAIVDLNSLDINQCAMAGASNKAFDYLSQGVPILVSDAKEWDAMFIEPGYGLSCDPREPKSIQKALEWFYQHKSECHQMGLRGRDKILSDWNYEKQFAHVMDRVVSL